MTKKQFAEQRNIFFRWLETSLQLMASRRRIPGANSQHITRQNKRHHRLPRAERFVSVFVFNKHAESDFVFVFHLHFL